MNQTQYKILIVEDDIIIGEKMKSHLERWAYKVRLVEDFQDVLGEVTSVFISSDDLPRIFERV